MTGKCNHILSSAKIALVRVDDLRRAILRIGLDATFALNLASYFLRVPFMVQSYLSLT